MQYHEIKTSSCLFKGQLHKINVTAMYFIRSRKLT